MSTRGGVAGIGRRDDRRRGISARLRRDLRQRAPVGNAQARGIGSAQALGAQAELADLLDQLAAEGWRRR